MRAREKAALSNVVHDLVDIGADAKAQALIHHLLSQRHLKARIVLEKEQRANLETGLQTAKSEILEQRDTERDSMLSNQADEIGTLMEEASTLSPEIISMKLDEMKKRHLKELDSFDSETEVLIQQKCSEVESEKAVEFAHQLLCLKEEQLLELSKTLQEMTGDEEAAARYAAQAESLAADAHDHRARVTRETEEKMQALKEEKLLKEQQIKEKMAAELSSLERELQEEERRHKLREQEEEKKHDLLARRKLTELERDLNKEIRDAGEAEKDAILAKYNQDVKKISDLMGSEKDKSRNKLKEQLEARRNKRKAGALRKLEEKESGKLRELDEELRENKSGVLMDGAKSLHKAASSAYIAPPAPTQSDDQEEGTANTALQQLFEGTDIFKQLTSIEEMLGLKAANALHVTGMDKARPYLDIRDAQWSNSEKLKPADITKLAPTNFVIYRFGLFLSRMLKTRLEFPDVSVLLADSLPHNNYTKNAYRHSYYYEEGSNILFVRKERTESVGEFSLVIAHALAHLRIADLRDDSHPFFLRHFHRALRLICTDLFFGRASAGVLPAVTPSSSDDVTWEHALSLGRSAREKHEVVADLVDLRVREPTQLNFTSHELISRLSAAKDSNLREDLVRMVTCRELESTTRFLEARVEKINNQPAGSCKISRPLQSYEDLAGFRRARLGLQIDQLSGEVLENAKKTRETDQQLGNDEAKEERIENLELVRKSIANRISLLSSELQKKVFDDQ